MPPNDHTYRQAITARLRTLTPTQRRLVLGEALVILREELPKLPPEQQRLLAAHVAGALDAAGCRHEALLLRLALQVPTPRHQRIRRPTHLVSARQRTAHRARARHSGVDVAALREQARATWHGATAEITALLSAWLARAAG